MEWETGKITTGSDKSATPVVASAFGLKGIAHNRNKTAVAITTYVASTNGVTFTSGENIREVTVSVPFTASCTGVRVAINASTDAMAKLWVEDDGAVAQDVMYIVVPAGTSMAFQRTSAILRVDMLSLGATTQVGVEGVGVV